MYEYSQPLNQLNISHNLTMGEITLNGLEDNDRIEIKLSVEYQNGLIVNCSGRKLKSRLL